MKKFRLKLLAAILMVVGFFAVLGWAGDYDYCEQVILGMTQEQYDYVKDTLTKMMGSKPSEREIAHWWTEHQHSE